MADVPTEIEQYLADLPADTWADLSARVRPPEEHPDPRVRAAALLRGLRAGGGGTSGATGGTAGAQPASKTEAANALRAILGRSGGQPSDAGPAVDGLRAAGFTASHDSTGKAY